MKLYILYWRSTHNGATGDIYCEAPSPAKAVSHFRKALREHGRLDGVIVTGIAEELGHLSLRMVQP